MPPSPSHSPTSALAGAALALAVPACGNGDDRVCGPGDAPAEAITLTGSELDVRYGGFVAGPNNDCPDPDDPDAPTSLTIVGTQVGTEFPLTLCVRRPDRLADAPAQLGAGVVIEDVGADTGGCTLRLDRQGAAPTGTLTATGLCDDGADAAGFAMALAGEVSVIRTCGDVSESLRVTLSGRVAVAAQP